MNPVNLFEFEALAKDKLEKSAYDYIAGGAEDGVTLRENRQAWERIQFHPRVLVDVSKLDLKTCVLGQEISFPVILAPTALQKLSHPEGEIATARAAAAAGTIFTLSSIASCTIEEVAKVSKGPLWFQLYYSKDRQVTKDLLERAKMNNYSAICLTVDTPRLGRREQDIRNRFQLAKGVTLKNFEKYMNLKDMPAEMHGSALAAYSVTTMDPSLSWKDLDWLRSVSDLPILLKGIMTPEDALMAVGHGVDGIIVSNHGGRQLDGAPATIEVLPDIVDVVSDRTEVLVDGGIRRGTDVLKALALGAKAVLIGRPYVWGLAVDGEAGVKRVLGMLRDEFELAMTLAGATSVAEIDANLVSFKF
ncbi:alpha-hydroxy-acid oxidizing protein [Candidatus Acetothermia bacterium]|nr:alpha-hydroxy-acid oxidizing protein [Candidatus Acetothermia bacterium]MBI3643618.1 alpha-hydroxy-acid oxidizing protein [Candidatus Acetothermia bacterium]